MERSAVGFGAVRLIGRLRRAVGPGRSLASRLLLGFFLAFLIPGTVFVVLLERRLSELRNNSVQQLAAVRLAQASMQLQQDASFRAEWMDRRTGVVEEAAWSLARAATLVLENLVPVDDAPLPPPDAHGHVWTAFPEHDSMAYLRIDRSQDPLARRQFALSRSLANLMSDLRERRRSIATIRLSMDSGLVRVSPWIDLHDESIRSLRGSPDRASSEEEARFPAQRPPSGDAPAWGFSGAGATADGTLKLTTLSVPVRGSSGARIGELSMDVDLRGFVIEALERGRRAGDIWFAIDPTGSLASIGPRTAAILHWNGLGEPPLPRSADPEQSRLARTILAAPETVGNYWFGGRLARLASARVRSTGWVFVEGLSGDALSRIEAGAVEEIKPRSFSELKRYLVLVFAYLAAAVLAVVVLITRRISAPVSELVHAAEEIGRGRAVEISAGAQDEIGRLGAAIDRMGKRVERRVETLRRLHALFRAAYRTTDLEEVLARASEGIAAFTRAERVWFYLHDPDTNRLEAGWPGWNLTRELAAQLTLSAESRSITALVFKSGEPYVSNDLEHDPYVNRRIRELVEAENVVLCALKAEDKMLGVVVATNRPGGFGHEEVDAVTTFADAASLLIKNVRLYSTLTRTVEELRRASRLKDHFLQNVNHELRTPLTSIVAWTDLLEEPQLEEKTVRRGIRQVRQSARVLLALIDDLLDLARMDRGTLALELRPVNLGDVVQRSLDTVRLMAETRGVGLIVAPLPDPMPPIRADPLRIQQVLWNLLANAIKFTQRHGRVIVRVELEPERYLISVEDDGIGIPENELPHIFDRFRQVDGSPTRRHPGMGIGLALARSLVELHGGTIWAESAVGEGSRFTFSLPMTPVERRASATVKVAEEIEN